MGTKYLLTGIVSWAIIIGTPICLLTRSFYNINYKFGYSIDLKFATRHVERGEQYLKEEKPYKAFSELREAKESARPNLYVRLITSIKKDPGLEKKALEVKEKLVKLEKKCQQTEEFEELEKFRKELEEGTRWKWN